MNDEQYIEKLKAIEKAKQSIDDAVRFLDEVTVQLGQPVLADFYNEAIASKKDLDSKTEQLKKIKMCYDLFENLGIPVGSNIQFSKNVYAGFVEANFHISLVFAVGVPEFDVCRAIADAVSCVCSRYGINLVIHNVEQDIDSLYDVADFLLHKSIVRQKAAAVAETIANECIIKSQG